MVPFGEGETMEEKQIQDEGGSGASHIGVETWGSLSCSSALALRGVLQVLAGYGRTALPQWPALPILPSCPSEASERYVLPHSYLSHGEGI